MPAETFFEKCSKFNKLKHYDSRCKLRSTKKREKNEKEQVNVRHFSFLTILKDNGLRKVVTIMKFIIQRKIKRIPTMAERMSGKAYKVLTHKGMEFESRQW